MEKIKPVIEEDVFIAPGAFIAGDVHIKKGASIWPSASIRGDMAPVTIGENTSIQDNVTIHTNTNGPAHVGNNVTVGHNAIIHAATVEDNCIIGMGSIILDGAVIGEGSIVGAGAVVTPGTRIPPNSLVLGVPAKVVKQGDFMDAIRENAEEYVKLTQRHKNGEFGYIIGGDEK